MKNISFDISFAGENRLAYCIFSESLTVYLGKVILLMPRQKTQVLMTYYLFPKKHF